MALNVTTAVFGEGCNTATATPSLVQWDQGQKLKIEGVDLPASYQVEFSTVYTRNAILRIGNAAGVAIPNKLLQRSAPITAYIVLHEGENDRETEYWITIHITPRTPPETITPDPEEQSVIDETIAALQDGVADAEAAATSAEGSASDAADHAADAEAWAVGQRAGADVPDTDPTYHNNSKYYAGAAEAAAEEAGRHEASWESWARRAEDAADEAEASATGAGQAKADAEAAAQTATQKATAAGESATAAAGSAAEARQTVDGGVGAINTARDGALTAIGQAGTTQVNAVNQAGANQVAAVNQEGTTQVTAVEDKGAEVLDSIPQDYSELVDDVADLSRQLSDETTGLDTKAPVILETASGAIASFSDGADNMPIKKLVAQIEPVQDLHGYDSPWPAGGGKNKLEPYGTYPTTFAGGITVSFSENGFAFSGTSTRSDSLILGRCTLPAGTYKVGNIGSTLTGSITFYLMNRTTQATPISWGATQVDYSFTLEEETPVQIYCVVQSGNTISGLECPMIRSADIADSSYAPYSNICPISGWTGAEISGTGVNVWDEEWESGDINISTGAKRANSARIRSVNYIPVKPNTEYYVQTPYRASTIVCFYDGDKNYPYTAQGSGWNELTSASKFTTPSWCHYVLFYWVATSYNNDISINYPATDTEYHPYTGDQISVTFPTTIYGGEDEVISGKLKSTMAMADLGDLNWTYVSYYNGAFFSADLANVVADSNTPISDIYKVFQPTGSGTENTNFGIAINANGNGGTIGGGFPYKTIVVTNRDYTDAATFKAAMSGVQLCYELAEPVEYTTEPQTLDTLYGTNNIWSSTGDTEVTYPADTKLYIDNKITQAIANALNS